MINTTYNLDLEECLSTFFDSQHHSLSIEKLSATPSRLQVNKYQIKELEEPFRDILVENLCSRDMQVAGC